MIKNYYQYINEARQRGPLYHILSIDSLKHVIENNSIKGHHYTSTISTTRNKMMNFYEGNRPSAFFKLELDGDKLSNNYKIRPYLFKSNTDVVIQEWEEQVMTGEIKNAFKYITKVIIMKGKMDRAKIGWQSFDLDIDEKKPDYWFTSDAKEEYSMQRFIQWLKKNSPAPIYIQDGSKIYQDDEYLNSLINEPIYKIDYGYAFYYRGRTEMIGNDLLSISDALFPLNDENENIIKPVVGYNYENLHLMSNREAMSKLKELDEFTFYKKRIFRGDVHEEKYDLYFCKFQLYNQEILPEDGFVKKAKLTDMTPAKWIASRVKDNKAA